MKRGTSSVLLLAVVIILACGGLSACAWFWDKAPNPDTAMLAATGAEAPVPAITAADPAARVDDGGAKTAGDVRVAAPADAVVGVEAATNRTAAGMAESPVSTVSTQTETVAVPTFTLAGKEEGPNLISIALDDVPLQDVVRMFTRISGANIIATSTNLQGKVSVNLQDVEWKPALGSILDMYNLTIAEKIPASGIYSVVSKPPGAGEPLVASTVFLNYASAANVAPLVIPLLGPGGSVSQFPNGNALVLHATAANVSEIRKVVTEIDLPRKQVYIEAKFIELSDEAIKDLGINWQVLEGYGVGVSGMQLGYSDTRKKSTSNAQTLSQGDSRTHADAVNDRFDSTGAKYQESSTVTEEQPPGSGNFVSRTVLTPTRSVNDSINQSLNVQKQVANTVSRDISDIRTAVLSASDFKVVLSALKQMNGVSVVSNPKIIVANEELASIHIGENQPNIKGTVTAGQQGQANTTTYALDDRKPYFEFGISLDVTPTINASNITVRIAPTLNRFEEDKVAPDGNTYPIESIKTIKTVFSLESGKTAAIGGLTETDDRDSTIKIPLLGDIPLIGKYLFSYTHKEKLQQETIIFVTVGLADPQAIQRDEGLPEDADLVHRHIIERKASRAKAAADRAAMNAALLPKPAGAPAPQ